MMKLTLFVEVFRGCSALPRMAFARHWEAIDPRNVSRRLRAIGTPRVSHPWDWSICSPVVGRLASLGKLSLFQLLQNISCAVRLEKHSQILKLNWSFIDFFFFQGFELGRSPYFHTPPVFFCLLISVSSRLSPWHRSSSPPSLPPWRRSRWSARRCYSASPGRSSSSGASAPRSHVLHGEKAGELAGEPSGLAMFPLGKRKYSIDVCK